MTKKDGSFFTRQETAVLQSNLSCVTKELFVEELLKISNIKEVISKKLSEICKESVNAMNNRKRGFVSVLMKKELSNLENFEWQQIVDEFSFKLPIVFNLVVNIMLPNKPTPKHMIGILPRIGMVYSILLQSRHSSLSLIQRVCSLILMDNIADQKVYDRLQTIGVCLSYQNSLLLLEELGGSFNTDVIDAVKEKKNLRIIGDNVNFKTNINQQHFSHEGKTLQMHHAFASAILINDFTFTKELSDVSPQREWVDLRPADFLVNSQEMKEMRKAYITIIAKVGSKFIPQLGFMSEVFPQLSKGEHSQYLRGKTTVIPLETLPHNEQKYEEVVQILDQYEQTIAELHQKAEVELQDNDVFHIGGDQLTRERFSGAKRLRAGADQVKDKFGHLMPITFEFFHLLMNFLKVFNHYLFSEKSLQEVGTMKSELNRIKRTNFKEDVASAYDPDRDFITSYIDAHIVTILLHFFGMESVNSIPTKNVPPDFQNDQEKKNWVCGSLGKMLDEYLFKDDHERDLSTSQISKNQEEDNVIEEASVVTCQLANGNVFEIHFQNDTVKEKRKMLKTDGVFDYALLVLKLGLIFKELLEVCKHPDRARILRLMKQCLPVFKAKSNNSKYAVEILRFLMQQTCILSEQKACTTLYGMFVNTKGRLDSHIPADLQMEYLVKLVKKHIKHMFNNKSTLNISKKTKALSQIEAVGDNFDTVSQVKVRCKKHQHHSYYDDELLLIDDLVKSEIFEEQPGRYHDSFKNIKRSIDMYLSPSHFHEWIQNRIKLDGTDIAI